MIILLEFIAYLFSIGLGYVLIMKPEVGTKTIKRIFRRFNSHMFKPIVFRLIGAALIAFGIGKIVFMIN